MSVMLHEPPVNHISAIDRSGIAPPVINSKDYNLQEINAKKDAAGWRTFLSFVGPGFLVSLGYLDPGNCMSDFDHLISCFALSSRKLMNIFYAVETDLQAGADHRYELLWVILIGLIFALVIQSLAVNLGVCTGKHLSEICKAEYPIFMKYCLWLLAEIAVIAADIPEVIGTAFALNILFKLPLWVGVLLTGFSTLLFLGIQRYGVRKLEGIAVLVLVMAGCFFGEMSYVKPPAGDLLKGMFIPKLGGRGATGDTIALLGALVMPHNLFLHSALVLSRRIPNSVHGVNDACRYFLIESGFALFVAFLINVSIVAVSGTVCSGKNISSDSLDRCNDLSVHSASFLLRNVLGNSSSTLYAMALLASGQSSTITGTYAGQFIMQGFLELKMRKWLRNLITRCIAIMPSLIVSIIGGSSGAGRLIIIASVGIYLLFLMILSFELPFALIPLLKFSSTTTKMGPHKNSTIIIVFSWVVGVGIIGINIHYLSTTFVNWLIHSTLPKVAIVFIGMLVFPVMAIYVLSVLYLMFRKDVITLEPRKLDRNADREDLADIPYSATEMSFVNSSVI
uniref:Metal transporter n=1 Tax=Lactuca sativa TaxID=4236 RepID=A0A9R1V7M3_LACSA|nr:hypothetical protein LSAT_V11C600335130 [Lactuca sativa]